MIYLVHYLLYLVFLYMSTDGPGEVLDGAARLEEDLLEAPELELRLRGERAAVLTDVHLPPPVDVQDHLEVLRVPEEKYYRRRARKKSVTKIKNFRLGFSEGDLSQPRVRVSSQVSHLSPEFLPRNIDDNRPPVVVPIFLGKMLQ